MDETITPLMVLDYGFARGSRNVVLEPLGSGYPTVFLRGAQSRSGTLSTLWLGAATARAAETFLSGADAFEFEAPEIGEGFRFVVTGPITVRKAAGTDYWTVDVEYREVEPL